MQGVFLLFFSLFWSAGIVFLDGMVLHGIYQQIESRHYPAAAGQVTRSEVKTHRGSKGGPSYEAIVKYRFQVGGQSFTASRLRYGQNASDYNSAASMVTAHPEGSTVQVFYNPADPRDALLSPGLYGSDFLILLFLTPFNAIMFGLWMGTAGWLRERLFRPVAGGVKIISDRLSTRIRLPRFGPLGWGLVTVGGLGFVSIFAVGLPTRMNPSIPLALAVIAVVYLAGAGVYLWQWLKISSGIDDLVINQAARTLDLPLTFNRKQRLRVRIDDIESLSVEKEVHTTSKGGVSYTYAPTLCLRGADPGTQKLADWSDKVKADDFAEWLRKSLGL
jgi:hypothetical protein